MRAFALAIAFLLCGCGDSRLSEVESQTPVGELISDGDFVVSGRSRVRIYAAEQKRADGELPIAITNGEGFAAQIDGGFSGETIYLEIDGIVFAVFVEAKAGETQFIAP
ncbi:MAG: hypothetical protein LBO72_07780 [Helicobacteraceae bacterium]|jgi:hypothetical protein|nr:hypothetical protein [Helicobacteraceae bacterium]